ncbi:MAG: hypothetical protein Q8R79_03330, partial [Legionellaceae bacterium]|nr:hypothetical protein [Legionellaceae bacterium]
MKEGIQQHHHTLHPIHSLHYDFEAIFRAIQKSSDENTFENFLSFFSEEDQAILRAHIDSLYQVKGTPFENFTILLLTSFVGLFPSSIGGMLAHNMPLLEKDYSSILLLATAPTVFSSLRFLTAHLTDKGYGKEVIQSFLVCSILGQLGVSYLLKTNDLSTIQAGDFAYYAFLAASSFSSAAAATFPTCILLGKNTATNDTIEEQRERLVKFSEKNIQVQLSTLERHFNGVLRQKRTTRTMYLAGFGNFAPVLALTLMAQQTSSAPPSVSVSESIRNAHISNLYNTALILSVLALASTFFLKKPLVRQLMATHVTEEDARKLADILGQPHPPNHDSFYRKLRQFQSKDLLSVGAISFYY